MNESTLTVMFHLYFATYVYLATLYLVAPARTMVTCNTVCTQAAHPLTKGSTYVNKNCT